MVWWSNFGRYRSVSIVMIVTVAHVAMAAVLLSQDLKPMAPHEPDILEIELADLSPDIEVPVEPLAPLPEPEPKVPTGSPTPATRPTESPIPPPPDPVPATPAQSIEPQNLTVLTQLETAPTGPALASSLAAADETSPGGTSGDAVTPDQVASALQQIHCLKLKRHEEGDCPPHDPFAVAIASAERDIPPERLFGDPRYISKTVSDKIFEKEAANRFLWPDEDLFTDPMAPGAYNARRIRNGQEPLWSQEMRDGFRKSE